ncbi:TetR/AcrR family transcriptional regulator [Telmatospirillum sp.]|uniref:TetR/AcrR family transcriptional regulator n=1 Tax=Telmatospirillum sp. TaxID=2079197 RepID=UPI00283E7034|nr:TetR/AcrR family transcriptional regulator [Telmatospirillum sp.]MDR3436921.1 TetR/AcrR family transcriptional regulator [Telmatospirillum sp.]
MATDLFLARGYDGVSLDDIIAESGGSKTNIYSHFGGKEGLFVGIIEGLCDQVNAKLQAVDLTGLTLEEGLRRLGRTLLVALLDDRHLSLYRQVIGQSGRFPCIGHAWAKHGPEATRRVLSQFFTAHRDRLRGISPEQAAALFHDIVAWTRLNRAVFGIDGNRAPTDLDHHTEESVSLFIQGYIL